jgi:hypothetical protein
MRTQPKFNTPTDRLGVLKQDVKVYVVGNSKYIVLPKGLVVRDASPGGIGAIDQFDPFRFQLY